MTMLAWWGRGARAAPEWVGDSTTPWKAIIVDVTHCLAEMLKTLPAGKRCREEGTEASAEPQNKRP